MSPKDDGSPRRLVEDAGHWDRLAGTYERWLAGWPLGRPRRQGARRLAARPGERVLLVACGPAFERRELGPEVLVVGVDLSRAMLGRAAARLGRGRAARMDVTRLAFADGAFDAVLCCFICAVVPDGAAVLAEALRVTRPGGRVVIVDKLRRGPETWLRRRLGRLSARLRSDFNRPIEAVLAGRGDATITADETYLAGWVSVLRLEWRAGAR